MLALILSLSHLPPFLLLFLWYNPLTGSAKPSIKKGEYESMEIIHNDELVQVSKEITLKALDKNLIPVSLSDYKETAKNIARFYNEISNALSESTKEA